MKKIFAFIFVLTVVLGSTALAKKRSNKNAEMTPEPEDKRFPGIVTYEAYKQKGAPTVQTATNKIRDMLEASKGKVKGIWFKIHVNVAHWITACHKNGFELQLAVGKSTLMKPSEVIYMKKWLDTKTPSPLPLPAFTTIGLGAVVMNDEDEYLVLAENPENDSARTRKLKGGFKLPGKALLPGEHFDQAIKRILFEEVNMDKDHLDFHGIILLNHFPEAGHPMRARGDMFITFMVTTKKEKHNALHAKHMWLKRDEITEDVLKTGSNYKALLASDIWKKNYEEKLKENNVQPKLFIPKIKEVEEKVKGKSKMIKKMTGMTYLFYPSEEDLMEKVELKKETVAEAIEEPAATQKEEKAEEASEITVGEDQ